AGAADDEPANYDHLVPMQMLDGLERRIPRLPPVLALAVFGFGSEELQVFFKDVLDAEEDVAEAGLPHQPGEPLAVVGDGRRRRLNGVLERSCLDLGLSLRVLLGLPFERAGRPFGFGRL